jgi:hypothetical protein
MARFGVRDHLSPSAVGAWDRCQMQYRIFRVEGAVSPTDAMLTVKQTNHKVILEDDMGYRILTGHNRANSELSEIYRADVEKAVPIFREDPNLETPVEKFVETEISYFDQILTATEPFRRETVPLEVEHQVDFTFGGIPIVSRLDLISNSENGKRIEDLKRQGQSPSEGSAAKSRQLVTYSAGLGIPEVGLVAVVENKKPVVKLERGTVTPGEVERVKAQYQAAAFQIENALASGVFAPVDHGDRARAWICSAKFCGAWKIGSKDVKTGRSIACPYGQRSEVRV